MSYPPAIFFLLHARGMFAVLVAAATQTPNGEHADEAFRADVDRVCRASARRMMDVREASIRACLDESWKALIDGHTVDQVDTTTRRHDLACDALKIISDTGGLGYATIVANATTPRHDAWMLLLRACAVGKKLRTRPTRPTYLIHAF